MIHTVFCAPADPADEWRSELLAHAWVKAGQPGELDRLVPGRPERPAHPSARDVPTMIWSPHPYTGDLYPPYQLAASLMEWLFVEPVEGTILLLESTSVLRAPIGDEVRPGEARGTAWVRPRGEGPFGLGPGLEFLTSFCVDRTLELAAVTLPVLIHSRDLRKMVARWLELMSLIRAETAGKAPGPARDADRIAYAIAAAEARVPHAAADLVVPADGEGTAPLVDSRRPVLAADGRVVWEPGSHRPGTPIAPGDARPGPGRDLLRLLAEVEERRAQRQDAGFLKPRRQQGVREGKLLGTLFLEIPGRADTVSLNASGAAIWEVCDGNRSLSEVHRELERRFDMPQGSLQADVEVVVRRLERIGALRLEQP